MNATGGDRKVRAKRATYTKAQIEGLGEMLRALPKPEPEMVELTRKEAIRLLAADLAGMRKKGYSLEQIADALTRAGVAIEASTLRNYLRHMMRRSGRGPVPTDSSMPRNARSTTASCEARD